MSPEGQGKGPAVKSVSCTACGGPLTLRAPSHSERVACGYCGSILDAQDPNLQIVQKYSKKFEYIPAIPLGSRGQIKGDKWEVIGYLIRRIIVEGTPYSWSEYLLFNPFKGFRWLAEYNGHWTFIRSVKEAPEPVGDYAAAYEYSGMTFAHFQESEAVVTHVLGEFYWQVRVGEKVLLNDFICPPCILSSERTENEISWSVGEYVEPQLLWEGFALEGLPHRPVGVAPAQPSPYAKERPRIKKVFFGAIALLIMVCVALSHMAMNKVIFDKSLAYSSTDPQKAKITDPVEIPGKTSNVEVRISANVSNSWIFLKMALLNEKTNESIEFEREISYYSGTDTSDGSSEYWSEGSRDDSVVLPTIPAGTYRLWVEPEADPALTQTTYRVVLVRDVPQYVFFFIALIAVSLPFAFHAFRSSSFERKRWSEGDHPNGPSIPYKGEPCDPATST